MVAAIQGGDRLRPPPSPPTATTRRTYVLRRLAFQCRTRLDASKVTDNDATTFLMAHFVRAAGAQNDQRPLVREHHLPGHRDPEWGRDPVHGADLTAASSPRSTESSALVRVAGQNAKAVANGTATRWRSRTKHVGGYVTLSDAPTTNSFAMFGATAGTNLRMIEGIWTISTGLQTLDFASSDAWVQYVPRFVRNTIPTL